KAWKLIEEVEELGGMAKAIDTGLPKMKIEEASARKQAPIDSDIDTIVGVNKFKLDKEAPLDTLEVDNSAVRENQIKRIKALKASRNQQEVEESLQAITLCCKTGSGNLLELAVDAARKKATLGEISFACEKIFNRYSPPIKSISGVYSSVMTNNKDFKEAQMLADKFAVTDGRRPRIMIAKMGQDGHDRGAKVIATSFADLGFDVDIGPLFQTPEEAARQAVENDVHILGVSSLAAGHKTLVPKVIEELKKAGRQDILVIVGGVIPHQDYEFLYNKGTVGIFGPGTNIAKAAIEILNVLIDRNAS
ncbi:MAG: methylmalonyl-CoA mutase, partial [Bacteroidetes bacterium]|nr:methylmalonyl-CoA mutase [Bacteroidota bacterium]